MKNSALFLSSKGETLSVAYRLLKEGVPVDYYLHDPAYAGSYKNVFTRLNTHDGLMAAVKRAEVVVIDTIVKNKKTARDLALLDKFGISHNVPDLYGRLGDILKSPKWDKLVIGGGEEVAQYELDRSKGFELAKKAGFSIPPYQEFKSTKEAVRFLQSSAGQAKEKWYFKADGNVALDLTFDGTPTQLIDFLTTKVPKRLGTDKVNCILQEAIEGKVVELSREGWLDPDGKLVNPNSTLEDKKLSSRNSGPRVGCAVSTVWLDKDFEGVIHRQLKAAIKHLSGYVGPLDANAIITPDLQAWFLEWTLRFGYSALYLLLMFVLKGKLGNFLLDPFKTLWKDGFVASQVLSLTPFPPTAHNRQDFIEMIAGNLIDGKIDAPGVWWLDVMEDAEGMLRVNGADGLIGVATAHDETMEAAIKKAYEKVDKIKITGNKQFWPLQEHLDSHMGRYKKLQKWGII
jgi:phosphoribosylamine-glycine ligase